MATKKRKMVSYTNKEVQMMLTDLLTKTVVGIGSVGAAHEWIGPLFTASNPYSPYYPPLNHMLAALEILDDYEEGIDASDRDMALAVRIETMLGQEKMRQREIKESSEYAVSAYTTEPLPVA